MLTQQTLKNGLHKGLITTWELSKVTVPLYIVITLLKYSGLLAWMAKVFEPAMRIFGLPGEAAIVIVSGYLLNLYAAVGALLPLDLSPREVTILGLMLGIAHSLLVESGITRKTGIKAGRIASLRLILSFIAGLTANLLI